MKHAGVEYIVGMFVLTFILATTGNFMWGLMACCIAWIILDIVWKRGIVVISIHASALLVVVAIWRSTL